MKSIQSVILGVLVLAVAGIYILYFTAKGKTTAPAKTAGSAVKAASGVQQQISVAYIDLDTLKEYYDYFKLKSEEMDREKQRIENEIQGGLNKLEKDRVDFLKRGESITQVEAETFQREYQTRYQQLGQKQQSMQNQHLENQAKALDEIQKRINDYLVEYNKSAKYNFIFSTGEGNLTLYYKDSAFNITRDVIKGLNDIYRNSKK
jgi:outer membrane protein